MATKRGALELHLRICGGRGPLFGPGKRQLLVRIAESDSLSVAAREMEMSYMRAWTLVKAMNREWAKPLVELRRGGNMRGSAKLTATGEKILELYDQITAESRRATRGLFGKLQKLR